MDGSSADFGVTVAEGGSGGLVEMLGMFGEQVGRDGLAAAVVDEWGPLTYAELDRRSDCVAWSLSARGVGSGGLVAVCMRNSRDLLVALLGVLKSRAGVTIVGRSARSGVDAGVVRVSPVVGVVELVEFGESLGGAGRVAEPAGADTAYVIFTSGSTGILKGVVVDHACLAAWFGAGAFVGVVRHGGDVFVRSAGVWRDDRDRGSVGVHGGRGGAVLRQWRAHSRCGDRHDHADVPAKSRWSSPGSKAVCSSSTT